MSLNQSFISDFSECLSKSLGSVWYCTLLIDPKRPCLKNVHPFTHFNTTQELDPALWKWKIMISLSKELGAD